MIINLLKKDCLFCLIIISCFTSFSYQETPTIALPFSFTHHQFSNGHIRHGIRTKNNMPSCYTNYSRAYYASLLPADFQHAFKHAFDVCEVLNNYPLYAFPNFIEFARTLPCYDTYILALHNKIQHDKIFRKQTACMPYFEYRFGCGYENSGFHNFITTEAQRITNAQKQKVDQAIVEQQHVSAIVEKKDTLRVSDSQILYILANNYTQKIYTIPPGNNSARLTERINAINQTRSNNGKCSDYSSQVAHLNSDDSNEDAFQNKYGTQLDCQLHKELCQTRSTMRHLERTYSNDTHVQILAPIIYRYTTQAKNEHCPLAAFELSDFCHTITQVLSGGMRVLYDVSSAIGKGVWKGANDFASIEHWKSMATGAVQLGLLFADAIGQEDALHYAMVLAATSNDSNVFVAAAEKYCEHTQSQKDAINLCAQETYKKIKAMSWQEVLENGTEIGTTMILDTLALNAASGFSCTASNLAVKQLNAAMESGILITEQYAVEVAGFGKLIIEEGAEVSAVAADIIKNDLVFFAKSTEPISQQIKQKLPSFISSKNIVQKIRNVGDDILDVMEAAGGHTLERHVGKTYDELLLRSLKVEAKAITTFTNKRTAINAVKENLKNNAEKIFLWFNNPLEDQIIIEFSHLHPIGTGVLKGKKSPFYNLTSSKMVLEKNAGCELGFKILTAFPII